MAETPNYSHPHSRGPAVLIVTVILMALATVFVLLRMVSRIGIVKRVTLDDYFMMLAWVSKAIMAPSRTDCDRSLPLVYLLPSAMAPSMASEDIKLIYRRNGTRR